MDGSVGLEDEGDDGRMGGTDIIEESDANARGCKNDAEKGARRGANERRMVKVEGTTNATNDAAAGSTMSGAGGAYEMGMRKTTRSDVWYEIWSWNETISG